MGIELGRISGPLLSANLLRKGAGLLEENLAFETDLLYLDVINGRIGIHTDGPTRELTVNGTVRSTNLNVDTQASIANFTISGNTIQDVLNSIYIRPNQSSDPKIVTDAVATANIKVSDQLIQTTVSNSDINFKANGTGKVIFNTSRVNVLGNLHATGNITFDGDIVFGNSNADNVSFSSDVKSDLLPDLTNTYELGSPTKVWGYLYAHTIKASNLTATSATVNSINLTFQPAKIYYVSVNGNDANVGSHQHATFATVKHALSVATSGDTVFIYPGTYTEEFPLTVPAGVTVTGEGVRAVKIKPTLGTNTQNAFLLNGETTVSNLTVADFFQGYAFSFAPNFTVVLRSPYIQNCTIITSGPNAGNGAKVDGSLANSASNEASMLFHSVTMIVPDAVGVQATNGARVEWLNSFTYFAYRGIYLTEGTLGFASLGVRFGAELRSINSANVYGTYGAVADGAHTLGYLIGHNFGYIGSATNSQNDRGLVIQANEIVELNSGRIYYETVDHNGDFRVGDIFYINQDTGTVNISAQALNFAPNGSITMSGPNGNTVIDATGIYLGNLRFYGNTIDSVSGPVNFLAYSDNTYLNTNAFVTGNLDVTGDTTISGNVYVGNSPLDTVTIVPRLTQNIYPKTNNTFNLGNNTTPKIWDVAYLTGLVVDNVTDIRNNTISTLTTNTDLLLSGSGTGHVIFENSVSVIANSLENTSTTATTDLEKSLLFAPSGTGTVKTNTTTSVIIPYNDDAIRPLANVGEIRLNSTDNIYEGYVPGGSVTLSGLYDIDRNTYITAETTPGANDNVLSFIINNSVKTTISSSRLYTTQIETDGVRFVNNTISSVNPANDILIQTSGTGVTNFNDISLVGDNIYTTTNTPLTIQSNGTGYVKFAGVNGVVIPVGTNGNQPVTADIGATRFNTTQGYPEVFDGTNWIPVYGTSSNLTENDIADISDLWAIVLG